MVAGNIKAVARRVAMQNAIWFYMNSTGELCTVSSISMGTAAATFTVDNGRIRWFANGMAIDIYNKTFTSRRNSVAVLVDGVDYLNKTVRIVTPDGSSMPTIVNGDKIVMANCYSSGKLGPYGLDDWMKASGTLFDSSSQLALASYPQFKSLVVAIGGSLTEWGLTRRMGQFQDAYDLPLDTILTTRGISEAFVEQFPASNAILTFQRQGQALNLRGGWSKIAFTYEGRDFDWMISPYVLEGNLYVLRLGEGNLKRYVPPSLSQAERRNDFGDEVEFIAPIGGHSGIFKLAHASTGATSPIVEAPFVGRCQIAPMKPQGIRLTGIAQAPAVPTTTTTTTSSSTTTTVAP
jgi:hypothetical protein